MLRRGGGEDNPWQIWCVLMQYAHLGPSLDERRSRQPCHCHFICTCLTIYPNTTSHNHHPTPPPTPPPLIQHASMEMVG